MDNNLDIEYSRLCGEFPQFHNPLFTAVLARNPLTVKFLLETIADANETLHHKRTPLHILALITTGQNDLEIANLLLNHGANPLAQDISGRTPLHFAFFERKWEFVALLLKRLTRKGVNPTDFVGLSILHIACAFGDDRVVCNLLDNGAKMNDCAKKNHSILNGLNALHAAILFHRKSTVELLVKRGAHVNSATAYGQTALHLACCFHVNSFKIEMPNSDSESTDEAERICQNQLDIIKLLLDRGANVEATVEVGLGLLFYICIRPTIYPRQNDLEITKLLLNHGANALVQDKLGRTPLHHAFIERKWPLVDLLLSRLPKGANSSDINELTVFHIACAFGDSHLVRQFLDNGAKINHCTMMKQPIMHAGFNALHFAILYNRKSNVELLLERGADVNSTTTSDQQTALHLACWFNDDDFIERLTNKNIESKEERELWNRSQLDIIKLLLDKGADLEATNKNGLTPLLYSCTIPFRDRCVCNFFGTEDDGEIFSKQRCEIIKCLLDRGASIDARQPDGKRTTLHLLGEIEQDENAVNEVILKVAKLLIKYGADINARDKRLWTPLHVASYHCRKLYVNALLRHGADVKVRTDEGTVPILMTFKKETDTKGFFFIHGKVKLVMIEHLLHVQRLLALGVKFEIQVMFYLVEMLDDGEIISIKKECNDELESMKRVEVDDDTSLYRILRTGRDATGRCVEESQLKMVMENLGVADKYPNYYYLMQLQMKRARLLESAEQAMRQLAQCELPSLCSDVIFKYLLDSDLRNLAAVQERPRQCDLSDLSTRCGSSIE